MSHEQLIIGGAVVALTCGFGALVTVIPLALSARRTLRATLARREYQRAQYLAQPCSECSCPIEAHRFGADLVCGCGCGGWEPAWKPDLDPQSLVMPIPAESAPTGALPVPAGCQHPWLSIASARTMEQWREFELLGTPYECMKCGEQWREGGRG